MQQLMKDEGVNKTFPCYVFSRGLPTKSIEHVVCIFMIWLLHTNSKLFIFVSPFGREEQRIFVVVIQFLVFSTRRKKPKLGKFY